MPPVTQHDPELAALQQEIEGYAIEYGLDYYPPSPRSWTTGRSARSRPTAASRSAILTGGSGWSTTS